MRRTPSALLTVLVVLAVAGCSEDAPKDGVPETTTSATSTPTARTGATTSRPPSTSPPLTTPPADREPARARLQGIDASHHQGPIDWAAVADHGIRFAYLKASEGTGFTDPRFADHRRAARAEGIAVGGYHYFQLCTDGVAQAAHFSAVLGPGDGGRRGLPPAVDLELAGSCSTPPPREELLAEVRSFLDAIERRHGVEPVVYLYPELEERYRLAGELAGYPQWVRRLGTTEPRRDWHIWQYDDNGTVPGIAGGVDLNLMQR